MSSHYIIVCIVIIVIVLWLTQRENFNQHKHDKSSHKTPKTVTLTFTDEAWHDVNRINEYYNHEFGIFSHHWKIEVNSRHNTIPPGEYLLMLGDLELNKFDIKKDMNSDDVIMKFSAYSDKRPTSLSHYLYLMVYGIKEGYNYYPKKIPKQFSTNMF